MPGSVVESYLEYGFIGDCVHVPIADLVTFTSLQPHLYQKAIGHQSRGKEAAADGAPLVKIFIL